jgi:hypothetical protein
VSPVAGAKFLRGRQAALQQEPTIRMELRNFLYCYNEPNRSSAFMRIDSSLRAHHNVLEASAKPGSMVAIENHLADLLPSPCRATGLK